MKDSCTHPECAHVLNMTASIWDDSPDVLVVDLAQSDAALQPWSLDCATAGTVAYRPSYEGDGNFVDGWYMLRISRVTDPDVLRKLNARL